LPAPVNSAENRATGVILKGVGGLYTVFYRGQLLQCGARGNLKRDVGRLLTGDRVELEEIDGASGTAVISEVETRKNCLERPRVANVDCLVLVLAAEYPAPDLGLADKMLIAARKAGIAPVLVINKVDQNEAAAGELISQYKNAAECFLTDAQVREGIPELFRALSGRISVLAGQSGVGKSTILNLAAGEGTMSTGSVSEKSLRGRHTTRHAEIFPMTCPEAAEGSFIIDSPGFSLLELDISCRDLPGYYPEVYNHMGKCRFQDCGHTGEPGCFVPGLVEAGIFHKERYARYIKLYKELELKEKNRYRNRKS